MYAWKVEKKSATSPKLGYQIRCGWWRIRYNGCARLFAERVGLNPDRPYSFCE